MPYNTRRKSLSLPSLGIHIPVTHAARVAAAAKASSRATSSPTSSASPSSAASTSPPRSSSPESHPSKRQKRAHGRASTEQTPPPSPTPATTVVLTGWVLTFWAQMCKVQKCQNDWRNAVSCLSLWLKTPRTSEKYPTIESVLGSRGWDSDIECGGFTFRSSTFIRLLQDCQLCDDTKTR